MAGKENYVNGILLFLTPYKCQNAKKKKLFTNVGQCRQMLPYKNINMYLKSSVWLCILYDNILPL